MTNTNSIVIVGRLTRDFELKTNQSGYSYGRFTIANNYRKKNGETWGEEANYFDIVLVGKSAESLSQFLTKGKQVCVTGELRQSRWEDNGQTKSKIEIMAHSVEIVGSSQNSQNNQNNSAPQQRRQTPPAPPAPPRPNDGRKGPECWDDDLPF